MKRAFAFSMALIILMSLFPSVGTALSNGPGAVLLHTDGSLPASSAAGTEHGDGLYTEIPYVPEYTGELSSQSRVILMDLETGNILIEQNGDVRAYPASTTKIMTALLLIENTKDDEWDVRLPALQEVNSEQSAKGSQLGLIVGDEPTRRDLLYGILLPSGCDCAYVTACLIAGSETDFVFMMNKRASEIGMTNTGYENSYGLASNGHYTTAEDMATLVRHAMQYELFRAGVSTESKTLNIKNGSGTRTLFTRNTNYLLRHDSQYYYKYAIGVKTGTATIADHCLTSAARKNGLELIAIVMNSDSNDERYTFSKEILEWGFAYYASEGGYYSMNVTNAYFISGETGCSIYTAPDSADESNVPIDTLPANTGVRVGAYRYDNNGTLWYMVWCGDGFHWAKSSDLIFASYVNDIKADIGPALSGVTLIGDDPEINGVISSRHNVKAVTVTVYDESGMPVTGGSNYPNASCTHTLLGTTVDLDVDLGTLPAGKYTCVTHVEAVAYVPDAPDREYFISDEESTLLIMDHSSGTDGSGAPFFSKYAYSYNSNTGSGSPSGGTADTGMPFIASSELPQKAGCVFAGWNTKPDGSGTTYAPGDAVIEEGSVTLYAIWQAGKDEWQCDIEAAVSDGKLELSGSAVNTIGITGAELTITQEGSGTPMLSKQYTCLTNTLDASTFADDTEGLQLTDGSYSIRLTCTAAGGIPVMLLDKVLDVGSAEIYSLVLVLNGGSIEGDADGFTAERGKPFGELPVPVKEGYEFEGWYDNSEQKVEADSIVPESTNGVIVLHANWRSTSSGDNSEQGGSSGSHSFLASIPLWVWLAGALVIAGGLIALIVIIIRKPDNAADDAEQVD